MGIESTFCYFFAIAGFGWQKCAWQLLRQIIKGLCDRAILAVLLGCGLRRSEVVALSIAHVQQRDGRWCIVDLVGKHGRIPIPMPTFTAG
jgi:site-specific recombinase XerD